MLHDVIHTQYLVNMKINMTKGWTRFRFALIFPNYYLIYIFRWCVPIPVCGRFGWWPFQSVTVQACGRFGFRRYGLWPLWPYNRRNWSLILDIRTDCVEDEDQFWTYHGDVINGSILFVTGLCAWNPPVTEKFPHKIPWRGALMFSMICAWTNGWVINRDAGNLIRHRAHYDVSILRTDCWISFIY